MPWFICIEHSEMSMLQVSEVKKGQLPHPKGPLVKVMPSSAIESANSVVDNVIFQWSQGSGLRKGIKYTAYSLFSCK